MFIAAVALGPPLGGIVVMALLQLVPAFASRLFRCPLPEFGKNLLESIALLMPLSYFVGGISAILGGLALAAYFAWGGRITGGRALSRRSSIRRCWPSQRPGFRRAVRRGRYRRR